MQTDGFEVLFVCTGNICRSPLAEYLLEERFRDCPQIRARSAGTGASTGAPMDPLTRQLANRFGVQGTESHRARQMTPDMLESADLVLTMTREQRSSVVRTVPGIIRRVFTLREFGRLAAVTTPADIVSAGAEAEDHADPMALRAAVLAVSASRGRMRPRQNVSEEDVLDPYGQDLSVHEESSLQVRHGLELTAALFERALMEAETA